MNKIILTCGQFYPIPVAENEGAVAQFLIRPGNFLQIVLPGMSASEQAAIESGKIVAGLMYEHGAMMLFFQFFGNDKPEVTFYAPYNVRLLPPDNRVLPNIDSPEQQFPFEIHAIDGNKILRVIRQTAMPPDMTLEFLNAVLDQLVTIEKPGIMKGWMERKPDRLIKKSLAWVLQDKIQASGADIC